MYGLAENYVTPFALLFGASVLEVSVLQGLAQLATGGGQLIGANLVQNRGLDRQRLCITTVILQASTWILTFFGAYLTGSPLVGIVLYAAGVFFNNVGAPGWNSWMNDLVPEKRRGAYWSQRNRILGLAQLTAISAAGVFLYFMNKRGMDKTAYLILFVAAFAFRMGSVYFLSHQYQPEFERSRNGPSLSLARFLKDLPSSSFGRFTLFVILINFTVVMLNPIIQVYLLQGLKLNYIEYTIVTMTATIATYIFMTYWGGLSDRFGNRRILIVTAVAMPFMALAWVFVRPVWALVILQLISGFVTSGFNLATTNYIFDATPKSVLPKVMAYFQTLFTAFGFLGSMFSGLLVDLFKAQGWQWGWLNAYLMAFAVAAVLRGLIMIFFSRRIHEVRDTEKSPGLTYFYLYKPFHEITGSLYRVYSKRRVVSGKK
jgi:MFS family permease